MGHGVLCPITYYRLTSAPAPSFPQICNFTISQSGKSLAPLPERVWSSVWCGFWMGTLKSKV
jgi:hypothetical protein